MQTKNDPSIENELVRDLIKEKRSDRRWRNLRSFAWLILTAYCFFNFFNLLSGNNLSTSSDGKYAALVRFDGMIAPGYEFSAETILPTLKEAFSDKNAVGIVIDINSPGGTPVQSSIIHDAIVLLKKQYHKKVVVVGEDMLTSGAYYVAVSADKIYVNPNTLTGSIGVVMKGFGFVEGMKKLGIERRVYVSGNNKDRLDPFLPQNKDDEAKVKSVMSEIHQNFVEAVLAGRKGKLKAKPEELFNGDFWSGETALKLGLVDELGNLQDVLKKEFSVTEYKEYSRTPNFLKLVKGPLSSSFTNAIESILSGFNVKA